MVRTATLRQAQPRQRSIQQRLQKQKETKIQKERQVISAYQQEQTKAEQKVQELKQQKESAAYQKALKDVSEWEQAIKIVTKGSRYDPRSSVGRKIRKIQESGGKAAIYGSASVYAQAKQKVAEIETQIKTPEVSSSGTIFLKPSEAGAVSGLIEKTGADIRISETDRTYTPETTKGVIFLKPYEEKYASALVGRTGATAKIEKEKEIITYSPEPTKKLMDKTIVPERKTSYYEPIFGTVQTELKDKKIQKITSTKKDVTIPELKVGDVVSAPAKGFSFFSKIGGEVGSFGVGAYYGAKGLKSEEDIAREAYKTKITQEQYGTKQDYLGGNVFFKQVEVDFVPAVSVGEKKEIGRKVGEITTMGGIYLSPVGTTVFASQVEGELREFDYNPIAFAKEKPMEAALIGGVILTAGAIKGVQFIKAPKVITKGDVTRLTTKGEEFFGKKIRISKADEISPWRWKAEIKPSERGYTIKDYTLKTGKADLKATETVGVDIKKISKDKVKEKVIYEKQQLGQESLEGSLVKVFKDGKEVYAGIPYGKFGQAQRESLFKTLGEKGISKEYLQQRIRYVQPKLTKDVLKEGLIKIKGSKAKGKFEHLLEQPVLDLGKGIKTRGKKTIKTLTDVDRKMVTIGEKKYVLETKTGIVSKIGKKGELASLEEIESAKSFLFSKKPREGKGYLSVKDKELIISEEADIQFISSTSIEKPMARLSKKEFELLKPEVRVDTSKTTLIKKTIEDVEQIGIRGGAKPSSKEYLQQLYSSVELKVAPKIAPPKLTPSVKRPTLELPTQELPSMVGGVGLKDIKYAGTGLYEQMEVSTIQPTSVSPITSYAMLDTTKEVSVPVSTLDIKTRTRTELKPLVKLDLKPKEIISPIEKITPKLKERVIEKVKEVQKTQPKLISLLKTAQVQRPVQREIIKQISRTIKPTIPKTKTPTPKIPLIKTPSLIKKLAKKVEEGMFEIFTTKGGKDILIGEAETQLGAEKLLKSKIISTLRAGGFIQRKGGIKLKALELKTFGGGEFRLSKVSPFKIIEKKARRLRKFTTGKQIQFFR